MRYFFITQDKNLPGSIQYRDFDINGSRHVFSKEGMATRPDGIFYSIR